MVKNKLKGKKRIIGIIATVIAVFILPRLHHIGIDIDQATLQQIVAGAILLIVYGFSDKLNRMYPN